MGTLRPYSNYRLLIRCMQPSVISFISCLTLGTAFVATHIVLLSLNFGTILPNVLDGQIAILYTNWVVRWLDVVFHSTSFSDIVMTILWGTIGFLVYSIPAYFFGEYRNWRETEADIQITDNGTVIRHPLEREFLKRAIWRIGIGIAMISFFVLSMPTQQYLLQLDTRLFTATVTANNIIMILLTVPAWAAVLHIYVILLRLYLLRTRIFGDNLLY